MRRRSFLQLLGITSVVKPLASGAKSLPTPSLLPQTPPPAYMLSWEFIVGIALCTADKGEWVDIACDNQQRIRVEAGERIEVGTFLQTDQHGRVIQLPIRITGEK